MVEPGALSGVVIADFSRVLAGPYATMLLADLGAEVIKVERPVIGDDTRAWGPPFIDGESTYFRGVNRNKRSIALDLTERDGLAAALRLASEADMVVENFRPGTMERLGLGYERIRSINPRTIYCSITGFGRGAGADLPGYDLLVQAVGGLMSLSGEHEPTKSGVAVVDVITGLHATMGLLAALRHRDRTGVGQRVEVSLLSSLLSGLVNQSAGYVSAGIVPQRMGNRHPSIAPYEVYQTADAPIVIAVGNDRQFGSLCAVLGLAGLPADPRFATNTARVSSRPELSQALNERLKSETAEHWFTTLTAVGVPCGPINDLAGAFELAERLGFDSTVQIAADNDAATTQRHVANPISLSATPATYRHGAPALGQDTDTVLADLDRR